MEVHYIYGKQYVGQTLRSGHLQAYFRRIWAFH